MVLAVCEQASIFTTKGTVIFDPDLGRSEKTEGRERGSVFRGRMKMTQDEYVHVCDYLRSLLLPNGIAVTFNGQQLPPRTPIHTFRASLETQIADSKGVMRPTTRKAEIGLYETLPGEVAALYEMGLPIVETSDKWHVSVGQKIPLNRDRNNVKPAYLRTIRTLVLNATHDRLTEADANSDWVRQASSSDDCSPEAIKRVLNLRFGDKFAAFDPNDKEAGKNFVAQGGQLVYGPMLSPQEWQNAKKAHAIQPAGKICPTPKPFSQDPDAKEVTVIPQEQWSPGMMNVARYSVFLGRKLMDVTMSVSFVSTPRNFLAAYGRGGNLIFNVFRLGHGWFESGINQEVIRLLLHEMGHEYCGDHLDEKYHDALCLLGARLALLILEKPDELRQWR